MRRLLPIIFLIILPLVSLNIKNAFAESLSVSLRVGDTRIAFGGYSSPDAFITIKQNASVVGTTVADASGNWNKTIDVDNPGIQTFDLYAADSTNISTPTLSYSVNLAPNSLTTISNIVFPSTITVSGLILTGQINPSGTLTLLVSDGTTFIIPVNPSGVWSFTIPTESFNSGTYTAYLTLTMPGNYISLSSEIISFVVENGTSSSSPSSSTTPSNSTQNTPNPSFSPSPSSPGITIKKNNQKTDLNEINQPNDSDKNTLNVMYLSIASPAVKKTTLIIVVSTLSLLYAGLKAKIRKKKK